MEKKRSKGRYVIPDEYIMEDMKMQNGDDYVSTMTGAYYASSLEYGCNTVPQFANAGDLVAPVHSEVKRLFKPNRPYGTFGALVSDEDQLQYHKEICREVIELIDESEITTVANSLDAGTYVLNEKLDEVLRYQTADGAEIGYKEAVKMQASFKEHNCQIQQRIDKLISDSGFQPKYLDGKKKGVKYPEYLLSQIAELARQKKSVTGFNLKIQVTGKHTIAKTGNYAKSSIDSEQLEQLSSKLAYREKESFTQGTVRVGTLVIPIQSVKQLKTVMKVLSENLELIHSRWPDRVKGSAIVLKKEKS